MDIVSTPRVVEEITAEWLGAALSVQRPGTHVRGLAIEDVMGGMSAKVRVRPDYDGPTDLPETLIVKGHLAAHDLGNSFSYEIEMRSYAEIVPTLEVNTPACFFAGTGAGGPMLILEDLGPKQVDFLDPMRALSFEQARAFLVAIARIHARHWNAAALRDGSAATWLSTNGVPQQQMNAYMEDNVSAATWAERSALPRGAAIPRALREQPKVEAAYRRFLAYRAQAPQTIVHGDEHPANLYLERDGTPGFLDWQSRKEAWCTSFAYFLILSLDVLDRRAWERELLQIYLAELTACGVTAPSFDEAWRGYRYAATFPYVVWFTNRPEFQPEPFCTAAAARAGWAMGDLEVFDLPMP